MPHVALAPFTGLRVCAESLRELGFSLPGLRRRGAALAELPALGLLTLAGMTPNSWSCSYHPSGSRSGDELLEEVLVTRPTLVAISALTASIDEAYAFGDRLRRAGVRVALGGLHVTACPDEAEQHCDAVVVGPGESVWRDLLADVERGTLQRRYAAAWRPRPVDWPTPRFDLLAEPAPRYTLQTERGCPLACDFCAASRLLGPFREKPVANITNELEAIARRDPHPIIELADDNTFAGGRDAFALCDALSASGARWFTESDWRIGERPELLRAMAAAGCVQVLIGIESMTFRYPGMGAKEQSLQRIMDAIGAVQEAGIAVNGCLILGADGETRESIGKVVQFVLDSPLADVQLTLQTPFPGTMLRRRLAKEGRLLSNRGWRQYSLLDVTYQPDRMTVEELESAFLEAVREVYSRAASARRDTIRRNTWRRNRVLNHRLDWERQ